jgi:hypothetical protein
MKERPAEDEVEKLLKKAGFEFQRNPGIAGLRPDFLVTGPSGQRVIIEVKSWDPVGGNTARALSQAEYYKRLTNADHAIVVLPDLKRNYRDRGVVSADALVETLTIYFKRQPSQNNKFFEPPPELTPIVFAAMPFEREYDDTYFVAMSHAAEKVNAACKRVDRTEFSSDIVEEIKRVITSSIAVIVDLSESKPNVLYEAGFSHALKKPTVHICSTPLEDLPFDVRNWNTIHYNKGQTAALRTPLAKRLDAVIKRA